MKCTWVDCSADAKYPHLSKDGTPWANLCDDHHAQVEKDCDPVDCDIRKMLSSWVKASGGAKVMAGKMLK